MSTNALLGQLQAGLAFLQRSQSCSPDVFQPTCNISEYFDWVHLTKPEADCSWAGA